MFGMGSSTKKLKKRDLEGVLPSGFSLHEEWVPIDGLGQVLLREMDSGDRDDWEWLLLNRAVVTLTEEQQESLGYTEPRHGDPRGLKPFLIGRCVIDPSTNERMFGHVDERTGKFVMPPEDVATINSLRPGLTELLYLECLRVCGLRACDADDAKKNYENTPALNGDSTLHSGQESASEPFSPGSLAQ